MRLRRFRLQLVMFAALALTMGACAQSSATAHPTATPGPIGQTATPGQTATLLPTTPGGTQGSGGGTVLPSPTALPVSGTLAAAPRNCPATTPLQSVAPSEFGMAAGVAPVWVSGFTGAQATLYLRVSPTHGQFGWAGTFQLNVGLPFPGPVTIQGYPQSGASPALWFQNGSQAATTEPTLQSSQAGAGSDASWDKFPLAIFIPQAGCYVITASWHGGTARIMFAAGQ